MAQGTVTRVLSVASECAPLVKTGGLADVVGALPEALAASGVEMRVLLPGYPAVVAALGASKTVLTFADLMGGEARVEMGESGGVPLLVLVAPHLYDRSGSIYMDDHGRDWDDNPERFAALCLAAAEIAAGGTDWQPDIVHAHDWQGGLAPYYIRKRGLDVGTIVTIHNIAFAGGFDAGRMVRLEIDPADYHADGIEFYGRGSALKAGLAYADRITTVSPRYASELMTPEFGMGFDGLIRARADALSGILNGIDMTVWNPAAEPAPFAYRMPRGKPKATAALREEFGLPQSSGPLAVVISRLSHQKGLDLLLEALPSYLEAGGQLALLGSGDPGLEQGWREAADRHEGVAVHIGYDEALSHRMMAGGEAVLVPSRFEPCGLTQLYGLRYGAIPVVARTGGLADTVIDANDAALKAQVATGVIHDANSPDALAAALVQLCDLHGRPAIWRQIMRNAMRHPVGWDASAAQYARLYADIVEHA
ncbi:glycogen synthase GlgA [Palleronia caenipelagi]|uniref:Glycogen synthase n=1 Tax=Palleronia caenipelagi TaxID=2489174 RepID=A0A547Q5B9_9RHOB|nr:glycogen synthase GlgA [Palleronia caenipelagi]TRD21558.1 glycogen synthase GlgA [Palleronia caenipelagi]